MPKPTCSLSSLPHLPDVAVLDDDVVSWAEELDAIVLDVLDREASEDDIGGVDGDALVLGVAGVDGANRFRRRGRSRFRRRPW